MGRPRELTIGVELDEWEEQALASAYERLGLTTNHEPTQAQLQAILLDVWTGFIDDIRDGFMDGLAFAVRATEERQLSDRQHYFAQRIEEAWLDADQSGREQALRLLGAWQTNKGRFWTLTLASPKLLERRQ